MYIRRTTPSEIYTKTNLKRSWQVSQFYLFRTSRDLNPWKERKERRNLLHLDTLIPSYFMHVMSAGSPSFFPLYPSPWGQKKLRRFGESGWDGGMTHERAAIYANILWFALTRPYYYYVRNGPVKFITDRQQPSTTTTAWLRVIRRALEFAGEPKHV